MISELELIINELRSSMDSITDDDVDQLIDNLKQARRIVVVGVGRVLISLKTWVKRLKHLEFDINYLGSETEENVNKEDLVLVASSSGESLIPVTIARKAKDLGCKVFYVGCNSESTVSKLADQRLILLAKTKNNLEDEFKSKQPMSTLFEQQLMILGDCLALRIINNDNLEVDVIKKRHANLE